MTETVAGTPPRPADPLSLGSLLDGAWVLLRRHPLELLVPLVLLGALTGGTSGVTMDPDAVRADPSILLPYYALLGVLAVVLIVVVYLATTLAWLTTAHVAVAAVEGRPVSLADAFRHARGGLMGAAGTGLLWLLAVVVGFALLVVPGFIVLAALFPLLIVVAREGVNGVAALRRTWSLTRGHRGVAFVLILLAAIAAGVADAVVGWFPLYGGRMAGAAAGVAWAFLAATMAVYHKRVTQHEHVPLPAAAAVLQAP